MTDSFRRGERLVTVSLGAGVGKAIGELVEALVGELVGELMGNFLKRIRESGRREQPELKTKNPLEIFPAGCGSEPVYSYSLSLSAGNGGEQPRLLPGESLQRTISKCPVHVG